MEQSRYIRQAIPSYTSASSLSRRSVPLRVILSVIFNNIYGYIGLTFAGVGMVFVLLFMPQVDFVSPFCFGDEVLRMQGFVTEVSRTSISVNEETVIKYRYVFLYTGKSYNGVSYSTEHDYKPDQAVPVEFEPDNPEISRIQGMKVKPLGLWILFICIFPAIGFTFLYFAFTKGIKNIRTIRSGIMTRGKFIKKVSTGGSINEQTIYDLYFLFKDMSGNEHTAKGSTHRIDPVLDEPEERILYDPADPSNAVVVDAMPEMVRKFLSSVPG